MSHKCEVDSLEVRGGSGKRWSWGSCPQGQVSGTCLQTCLRPRTRMCVYVCTSVYVYVCTCACANVCAYVCVTQYWTRWSVYMALHSHRVLAVFYADLVGGKHVLHPSYDDALSTFSLCVLKANMETTSGNTKQTSVHDQMKRAEALSLFIIRGNGLRHQKVLLDLGGKTYAGRQVNWG